MGGSSTEIEKRTGRDHRGKDRRRWQVYLLWAEERQVSIVGAGTADAATVRSDDGSEVRRNDAGAAELQGDSGKAKPRSCGAIQETPGRATEIHGHEGALHQRRGVAGPGETGEGRTREGHRGPEGGRKEQSTRSFESGGRGISGSAEGRSRKRSEHPSFLGAHGR